MIAKRIPGKPVAGKKSEVAAAYGLTISELSRAMYDYLQSEGYDQYGAEYASLHEWLTLDHYDPHPDRTPWQKGDDLPQ